MKSLMSLVLIASLASTLQFGAFAQNTPADLSRKAVDLALASQLIQLEKKEMEPVFETRTVPDTCSRQVQRGTRQECHTEYDHQCHTEYSEQCENVPHSVCENVPQNVCNTETYPVCENVPQNVCNTETYPVCQNVPRRECTNVPHSVCTNVPEQVCQNVPTQECHEATVPVCQNVPRQVCETTQQCTTVNDSVCHGNPPVCQNVPRRECKPVQSCRTVSDSVCHNETRNQCTTVNHQQCHTENRQRCHDEFTQSCHDVQDNVCHNESRQSCHMENRQSCHNESRQNCHMENRQSCHNEYSRECHQEPSQSCTDTPRQACEQIPNMETETYACTKEVQVQVGERIKLHTAISLQVIFQNFGAIDVSKEKMEASIVNQEVKLRLTARSGKVIFRVVKTERKPRNLSQNELQIDMVMTIQAISVDQLTALSTLQMTDAVLYFDKMKFKISGANLSELPVSFDQGHLKVLMYKTARKVVSVIDQNFDPMIMKRNVDGSYQIEFPQFRVSSLSSKQHDLELNLGVKKLLDPKDLVNAEDLPAIAIKPIVGKFSGFPVNDRP